MKVFYECISKSWVQYVIIAASVFVAYAVVNVVNERNDDSVIILLLNGTFSGHEVSSFAPFNYFFGIFGGLSFLYKAMPEIQWYSLFFFLVSLWFSFNILRITCTLLPSLAALLLAVALVFLLNAGLSFTSLAMYLGATTVIRFLVKRNISRGSVLLLCGGLLLSSLIRVEGLLLAMPAILSAVIVYVSLTKSRKIFLQKSLLIFGACGLFVLTVKMAVPSDSRTEDFIKVATANKDFGYCKIHDAELSPEESLFWQAQNHWVFMPYYDFPSLDFNKVLSERCTGNTSNYEFHQLIKKYEYSGLYAKIEKRLFLYLLIPICILLVYYYKRKPIWFLALGSLVLLIISFILVPLFFKPDDRSFRVAYYAIMVSWIVYFLNDFYTRKYPKTVPSLLLLAALIFPYMGLAKTQYIFNRIEIPFTPLEMNEKVVKYANTGTVFTHGTHFQTIEFFEEKQAKTTFPMHRIMSFGTLVYGYAGAFEKQTGFSFETAAMSKMMVQNPERKFFLAASDFDHDFLIHYHNQLSNLQLKGTKLEEGIFQLSLETEAE